MNKVSLIIFILLLILIPAPASFAKTSEQISKEAVPVGTKSAEVLDSLPSTITLYQSPVAATLRSMEVNPSSSTMVTEPSTGSMMWKRPISSAGPYKMEDKMVYQVAADSGNCETSPCRVFTVIKSEDSLRVNDGDTTASTNLPIKIEESRIFVVGEANMEDVILPSEAQRVMENHLSGQALPSKILKMELNGCQKGGVSGFSCPMGVNNAYQVEVAREINIAGIVPYKGNILYQLNAANGEILQDNSPWYLKAALRFFK